MALMGNGAGRRWSWGLIAARGLLALLLLWPIAHMIAAKRFGFSSWRFFGWGMYATPHPESLSRLAIVWPEAGMSVAEIARGLSRAEASDAYDCVDLFVGSRTAGLTPVSARDLCEGEEANERLARFRHFGSRDQLGALVGLAAKGHSGPAVVVVSRQRLALAERRVYTTQTAFRVEGGQVTPVALTEP